MNKFIRYFSICFFLICFNTIGAQVDVYVTSKTDVLCNGGANGQVKIDARKGQKPYNYSRDGINFSSAQTFDNLKANTYTFFVKDNKGKVDSVVVSLSQPNKITYIDSSDLPRCPDDLSGGIFLNNIKGGKGSFYYKWISKNYLNPFTTRNIAQVSSGTYFLEIKDDNNCIRKDTFFLKAKFPISYSLSVENITCNNKKDGKINIKVLETTFSSSILWKGPNNYSSNLKTISNLSQGMYYLTVEDDTTGCVVKGESFIERPAVLEVSLKSKRDVLCFGDSTGLITPQIIGGTKPYIYEWDGPNKYSNKKEKVIDGRKGTYHLYLTDIQGCKDTLTVSLMEPSRLLVADNTTPISCFGRSDGSVKLTINGGLRPYDFQWSNGSKNQEITNAVAGNYEITITDSSGCVTRNKYKIEGPDALEIDYNKSDVSCFGKNDGRFTLIVSGGSIPFSYHITTPADSIITTVNNRNITPGAYKIKVVDSKSCKDSLVIQIQEPKKLDVTPSITHASCAGFKGSLGVSVSGGSAPFTFQWLDSVGSLYAATQNVVTAEVGVYYLNVKDANSCTTNDTVELLQPQLLKIAVTDKISPSCIFDSSGSLKFSTVGGTHPYRYKLNTLSSSKSNAFSNLKVGRYQVQVEDSNKCVDTVTVSLTNLDTIKPNLKIKNCTLFLSNFGTARLTSTMVDDGSTDNCGISSFGISTENFSCSQLGLNKVYIDLVDFSGNKTRDSIVVTVLDTTKPNLKLKRAIVYLENNGSGLLNSSSINNGTSDNCGIDSFVLSKLNFDCSNLGISTIGVMATDSSGNKSSDSLLINVIDTILPIIKTKNINAYLNSSGTIQISANDVDAGSSDNCGIFSKTLSSEKFNCFNIGNNFVNYSIIDASNNKSSTLVRITIFDTTAPIVLTKSISLYLNEFGFAVLKPEDVDNSSYDNCRISSLVLSQSVFTCADLGDRSTVLTVTDVSGNVAKGNVKVTVLDTLHPSVITRDPTVYLDFNGNGVLSVFEVDKGSNDNCKLESISINQDKFLCADLGQKDLTFTAKDVSGNTSSGNFKAFIIDTIAPLIRVRNRDLYLNDSGTAMISPSFFNLGTKDNCTLKSMNISQSNFNESDLGNKILLFTATDQSGNRALEILNFKVFDTIAPTIFVPKQIRFLDNDGVARISVAEISDGITDNCSIKSISLSDSIFKCTKLGSFEVTVTAVDIANNKTIQPFLVELKDTIKPVLITQTAYINIDTVGLARVKTTDVVKELVENCGGASISLSKSVFSFAEEGDNFIRIQAVDNSGNKSASYWVKVVVSLADSDLDSIPDYIETGLDFDGDGVPNYLDKDSDNDGILDVVENGGFKILLDLDRDGFFNIYDLDSDGDGIFDVIESNGFDVEPYDGRVGIGRVTVNPFDGIPVLANEGLGQTPVDTDGDNVFDFLDTDSDDDLISDRLEKGNGLLPLDSDNDNIPNYRDSDSDNDGISDLLETYFDFDSDDIPNYIDLDSDNDGIPDKIETSVDFDSDGSGNWIDLDSDGDGILDFHETSNDFDKDGIGNWLDLDSDGDGILDQIEGLRDSDGDGSFDFLDLDSDNDFIPDSIEGKPLVLGFPVDTDGDGIADFRDIDSDDDGILDSYEGYGDSDGDLIADYRDLDSDNDGLSDEFEGIKDIDGDGLANYIDKDSDGDGIADYIETAADFDGDRVPNCYDLDSDNDGINDLRECGYNDLAGSGMISRNDTLTLADIFKDIDQDGQPNFLDLDSDGDGIFDVIEAGNSQFDENNNGMVDGPDTDFDGILDRVDGLSGAFGDLNDPQLLDSDFDGIFDFEDLDSDGDFISDEEETAFDTDFDGLPNYLDSDSDGDGIPDFVETNADFDNDGRPNYIDLDSDNDKLSDNLEAGPDPINPIDSDGDGAPDYLDLDSDNDGIPDEEEGENDWDKNGIPDYRDPQLFVPEIFTPNGDGINELLIVKGLNNYPNASIVVFNQWGQVVFESNGPYSNNWGGEFEGDKGNASRRVLPEGIYFYTVNYNQDSTATKPRNPLKGNIYIKP